MTRLAEIVDTYNETILEPREPPMTVRRLAKLSGIPERTVYRHYNGLTSMSLSQAVAYARALNCRVEELHAEDAA